ncbi:efflux transporter outer membrane subunit [Lutibacter sp. HS1-25]|uniref:efflux transporter outer membrane subunit n=1 Tax=Lutibacter sp. HS1-25 TaxID=2485000 RepID=UPI0010125DC8|nr:efflux transporter outer membrane subunit [Lutibacter sp. HS1-25]RXP44772.1 efflux transporter outer membrane subunit [Lutibacter sp. HS1-25]
MKQKLITYLSIFLVILTVTSCKVGPNYHEPKIASPEIFKYENNKIDSIIDLKWWEIFKDPILDSLINVGLRENKDLLIAASRVDQARANLGYNKADYGPKIGVQASASGTNNIAGNILNNNIKSFGASATFNWEIDFWGKYRRSTEAARASLLGSFYGKRAVELGLISEIARNYFQLMNYKTSLAISKNTVEIRNNALKIIQNRFDKGYTNIIDVNQAQIQKAIAEATIPVYQRQIAFTENNLSVLLGKYSDNILVHSSYKDNPLPADIPSGIPSEMLQRRPDILQSEQLYKQQNALIGVATAMRFPSISLTGLLGVGSNDMSSLLNSGLGWSAGANLLSPLFEWGKNARRVDIEREKAKQYLLSYEKNILVAFSDVNNALTEISTYKDEMVAYKTMLDAAQNASKLSYERYYQGVTSYLEVILNEQTEFEAQLSYSKNYQDLLISYVNLYQALGGGWISNEELDKYAEQVAKDQGVDVSLVDKSKLVYQGQVVDYHLTPEQEKARKEFAKIQRKKEREERKSLN